MKTAALSMFIVEDDPGFRETFIDVMSLRGVEVRACATGREALNLLRFQQPSVILVDVQLPDVHGFELCRKLKRMDAFKNTPIILISASTHYNDAHDQVEGLLAGASLFVQKPMTMEKLWKEIEFLLKERK
jgi:DNA-binding response OmpR family regulator